MWRFRFLDADSSVCPLLVASLSGKVVVGCFDVFSIGSAFLYEDALGNVGPVFNSDLAERGNRGLVA